ncbi:MAG: tyrosinase family protein [Planctomycetaceae bacterium]|nr:tyrosinase family protein [Planctomycetaceae bacterium]
MTSPKDPLFFLLHANVDRAWLLWQRKTSSFDRADASHFFPQGTYVPGSFHHGSFAGDEQWPWNLAGGDLGMPGSGDDWPEFTFPLPGAFNGHGPSAKPITGEAVDFINSLGSGPVHNYSYDSAPYHK